MPQHGGCPLNPSQWGSRVRCPPRWAEAGAGRGVPSLLREWDGAETRVRRGRIPMTHVRGPSGLRVGQEATCRQGYGCCLPAAPQGTAVAEGQNPPQQRGRQVDARQHEDLRGRDREELGRPAAGTQRDPRLPHGTGGHRAPVAGLSPLSIPGRSSGGRPVPACHCRAGKAEAKEVSSPRGCAGGWSPWPGLGKVEGPVAGSLAAPRCCCVGRAPRRWLQEGISLPQPPELASSQHLDFPRPGLGSAMKPRLAPGSAAESGSQTWGCHGGTSETAGAGRLPWR